MGDEHVGEGEQVGVIAVQSAVLQPEGGGGGECDGEGAPGAGEGEGVDVRGDDLGGGRLGGEDWLFGGDLERGGAEVGSGAGGEA